MTRENVIPTPYTRINSCERKLFPPARIVLLKSLFVFADLFLLFIVFGGLSASNRKMKGVFSAVFGQKTGRKEKENWRIQ